MLTVTRKPGQTVRIGDGIRITVKEVRGRRVRLMIEAPREIAVFREEVYLQIEEENRRAAAIGPEALESLE